MTDDPRRALVARLTDRANQLDRDAARLRLQATAMEGTATELRHTADVIHEQIPTEATA